MSDLDLRGLAMKLGAQGPAKSDDSWPFTTGTVYAVDSAAGTVQVGVHGGVVTLPAVAGRYSGDSLARVLMDPFTSRPSLVIGPVFPTPTVTTAVVTAVGSSDVDVSLDDGDTSTTIPDGGLTLSVDDDVYVILDDWGTPVYTAGVASHHANSGSNSTPSTTTTVKATATIGPQVSGTYRTGYGWDAWNVNRYGGKSDIYQGNAYGSGLLKGFAGYGNQVANLHAVSIESITLKAKNDASGGLTVPLTVQGSPSGSRPGGSPSSSGDTASSGSIAYGSTGTLSFTSSMREAFRTGSAKGLVAVGSSYGGFGGTATPGSFVLTVHYTKNA